LISHQSLSRISCVTQSPSLITRPDTIRNHQTNMALQSNPLTHSLFTHLTAVADKFGFSMHICQSPDKLMHICDSIFNSNHATCHRLGSRHMPLKIKWQLIWCSPRCFYLSIKTTGAMSLSPLYSSVLFWANVLLIVAWHPKHSFAWLQVCKSPGLPVCQSASPLVHQSTSQPRKCATIRSSVNKAKSPEPGE